MARIPTLAEASTIKQETSHTYSGHFEDAWCIGSVPHGGYVTNMMMRVATMHFATTLRNQNQPHTIALHADFLRRTEIGPVAFTVRDVKLGRQASVIHITISQNIDKNHREEVVAYVTRSNIDTESGPTFKTNWALQPAPPAVDLKKLADGQDANWKIADKLPFTKIRKASSRLDWHMPRAGQAESRAADVWFRFNTRAGNGQRERFTNDSIGFIADMWPQLIEQFLDLDAYHPNKDWDEPNIKPARFWYPTLLLNIDVKKALPLEGVEWLFTRVSTKQVKNGRYDIDVAVMDETGEAVCLSHHVAYAVPIERNLAKRSKAKM